MSSGPDAAVTSTVVASRSWVETLRTSTVTTTIWPLVDSAPVMPVVIMRATVPVISISASPS